MRCLTVAIALAAASPAAAQPAVANRAVGEAEARGKAGDFLGAAAKYREAYAADPRPELICNIGIAYFKAKTELPRAQLFLSRCSERGGSDPKFAESLRSVLGVVENGLRTGAFAAIDVVVEPATASIAVGSFAPDESFLGSRVVWLPRGSHQLTATAEGHVARTVTVEVAPKEKQTIRIVLDRTPAPAPPPQPVEPKPPEPKPLPPPPPPEKQYREETIRHSKLPAIAATAGTAVFIGLAIYAKTRAQDAADWAPFAIDHDAYEEDKDTVESWDTRMAIAGSLAVVSAGVTGYLWYRALSSTTQRIEITASDHGASVSLTHRF